MPKLYDATKMTMTWLGVMSATEMWHLLRYCANAPDEKYPTASLGGRDLWVNRKHTSGPLYELQLEDGTIVAENPEIRDKLF